MNHSWKPLIPEKCFSKYFDTDNILSFECFIDILYQLSKTSYNNFDIQYIFNTIAL